MTLCAYLDLGVNLLFEKRRPYAFILGWATIREGRVGPWLLVCQFVEISNQMELNGEV